MFNAVDITDEVSDPNTVDEVSGPDTVKVTDHAVEPAAAEQLSFYLEDRSESLTPLPVLRIEPPEPGSDSDNVPDDNVADDNVPERDHSVSSAENDEVFYSPDTDILCIGNTCRRTSLWLKESPSWLQRMGTRKILLKTPLSRSTAVALPPSHSPLFSRFHF